MMQPLYGGAAARPFVTHHNTLDIDLYLRIAPELYLKRLVVGGMERVYEINRNFRNEGLSTQHNPEFTMLEFYQAYTDYRGLMDFSEELLRQTAIDATGSTVVEFDGQKLDFASVRRFSMREAVIEFWKDGEQPTPGAGRRPGVAAAALRQGNRGRGAHRHLRAPRGSRSSSSPPSSTTTRWRPRRSPRTSPTSRASSSASRSTPPAWRSATPTPS